MKRVLLAPDKFKSTLSSREVAEALYTGIQISCPQAQIASRVVSDGGEGFIEALEQSEALERHALQVRDPKGRFHTGYLGVSQKHRRVYIESCQATGFHLLTAKEKNPLFTSSEGMTDLLQAAGALHPVEIYVGLGSSATCDAGIATAGHFGYKFLDTSGHAIAPQAACLEAIETILPPDEKPFPEGVKLYAVADVVNPPVGAKGGVKIYAPQKGAGPAEVEKLENGMKRLIRAMQKLSAKDFSRLPGGGAAGCLALGLHFFFGAGIVEGSRFLFEKLNLEKRIQESDIVITGEGSFDEQSFFGKITGKIIEIAQKRGKKIIIVSGRRRVPEVLRSRAAGLFSVEQIVGKEDRSDKNESRQALLSHGQSIGHLISKL